MPFLIFYRLIFFFPSFFEIFSGTIVFRHFASRKEKRKMSRAPKQLLHGDPQFYSIFYSIFAGPGKNKKSKLVCQNDLLNNSHLT